MIIKKLEPRTHDNNNGLDYILAGDYYIPAISLPETDHLPIGKWEQLHKAYLKMHALFSITICY